MGNRQIQFEKRDLEDHIAIGMYITNQEGELLVLRHAKWGWWSAPVGKAEDGESAEEAMRREAEEELGITHFDSRKIYEVVATYHYGDQTVVTPLVGFELTNMQEPIHNKEADKHLDFGYLPLGEVATKPALSDQLITYLNLKGVSHSHAYEGQIA